MKKLFFILLPLLFLSENSKSQSWSSVGNINAGPFGPLTVYNNKLFASVASYDVLDTISDWNGSTWSSFLGTQYTYGDLESNVLSVYNGNLVVGGFFNQAGNSTAANNIATWNGTTWSALGTGVRDGSLGGGVFALTIFNGNLIAAGIFDSAGSVAANNIAQWNGSSWDSLGRGTNVDGQIYALTTYNGNLIAGGWFDSIGGVPVNNIAMWNGTSWSALGSGIGDIFALIVYNGNLLAGGTSGVAEWNGTMWNFLPGMTNFRVLALTEYNGNLIAGGNGRFNNTGNGHTANNIAMWNGSYWSTLGTGLYGTANFLAVYNGSLYVSGGNGDTFIQASGFDSAGGVFINDNIAEWTDTTTGINNIENHNQIRLYPNPSNGILTIQSPTVSGQWSIEVYNMLGEKVYSNYQITQSSNYQIDLSSQPAGTYLCRAIDRQGNLIGEGKIIIQR